MLVRFTIYIYHFFFTRSIRLGSSAFDSSNEKKSPKMHVPNESTTQVAMTAAEMRLQRSNQTGIEGLIKNKKVLLIALFAS